MDLNFGGGESEKSSSLWPPGLFSGNWNSSYLQWGENLLLKLIFSNDLFDYWVYFTILVYMFAYKSLFSELLSLN